MAADLLVLVLVHLREGLAAQVGGQRHRDHSGDHDVARLDRDDVGGLVLRQLAVAIAVERREHLLAMGLGLLLPDLPVGADALPDARALSQASRKGELDRALEQAAHEALEAGELDQGEADRGVDLDQQVDVAVRSGLAARGRSEQRQTRDAAAADVGRVRAQQREYALTLGSVFEEAGLRRFHHGAAL